mmetsp:Transcript_33342/g.61130  ORF Transcript_33342/g.61130 Transcript_33342/m.61130 type:complete len:531 (+) Transcript_33342:140-1732(+)
MAADVAPSGNSEPTDAAEPATLGGWGPARGTFTPDEFKVDTDTEYDDIDLESYPPCFKVEMSGKSMLNGIYRRMPIKCRGRPTYIMQDKKKILYFYYSNTSKSSSKSSGSSSKKSCRWVIGADFGSKKMYAKVKEVEDITPPLLPLEPYPYSWQVCFNTGKGDEAAGENGKDKEKSTEFRQMDGMRVAILHEDDKVFPDGELPVVKAEAALRPATETKSSKSRQPKEKVADSPSAPASKGASSSARASSKEGEGAVAATNSSGATSSSTAAKDGEKQVESSESESESYSSSSSALGSGGSDSEAEPSKPQQPPLKVARITPPAADPNREAPKKKDWRASLVGRLAAAKDINNRKAMLNQIRGKIEVDKKFQSDIIKAAGKGTVDGVLQLLDEVEQELCPLIQRRPLPKASALKKDGGARRALGTVYFMQERDTRQKIDSFKSEQLWIHQPGFWVICDKCNKQVEQKHGRLYHSREEQMPGASPGSPGLSLFVQDEFYCADCKPLPQTDEHMEQAYIAANGLPGYQAMMGH